MMAIIMAGGKGSRLKPYTMSIPKPLLPLGDTPILEIVLSQLAKNGINKVVISLGHMAPIFKMVIGDGENFGLDISYIIEDYPLGTAGSLRLIDDLEENFLVMNGDVLTTLDFNEIITLHKKMQSMATIAVHKRVVNIEYGVVEYDKSKFMSNYIEKPSIPYDVSMGINILNRKVLDYIPKNRKFDIPELMKEITNAGKKVLCYSTDCYWQDIGRFDDYQKASKDFVESPNKFIDVINRI